MTMLAGSIGHTFGVKVQRVQRIQRIQRVMVAPFGRNIYRRLRRPLTFGDRISDV